MVVQVRPSTIKMEESRSPDNVQWRWSIRSRPTSMALGSSQKTTIIEDADLLRQLDGMVRTTDGLQRALGLVRNPTQVAELMRSLLLNTEQSLVLMSRMQKVQTKRATFSEESSTGEQLPEVNECSGRLTLSDVRFPLLVRDDTIRLKNEQVFFVALVRCGSHVLCSDLFTLEPNSKDISFPNVFTLDDVCPDFSLTVDLHYCSYPDNVTSYLKGSLRSEAEMANYKFRLIASAVLSSNHIRNGVNTQSVTFQNRAFSVLNSCGGRPFDEIPHGSWLLWDHCTFLLSSMPNVCSSVVMEGLISIQMNSDSPTDVMRLYGSLTFPELRLWRSRNTMETPTAVVMLETKFGDSSGPFYTDAAGPCLAIRFKSVSHGWCSVVSSAESGVSWSSAFHRLADNLRLWPTCCFSTWKHPMRWVPSLYRNMKKNPKEFYDVYL